MARHMPPRTPRHLGVLINDDDDDDSDDDHKVSIWWVAARCGSGVCPPRRHNQRRCKPCLIVETTQHDRHSGLEHGEKFTENELCGPWLVLS